MQRVSPHQLTELYVLNAQRTFIPSLAAALRDVHPTWLHIEGRFFLTDILPMCPPENTRKFAVLPDLGPRESVHVHLAQNDGQIFQLHGVPDDFHPFCTASLVELVVPAWWLVKYRRSIPTLSSLEHLTVLPVVSARSSIPNDVHAELHTAERYTPSMIVDWSAVPIHCPALRTVTIAVFDATGGPRSHSGDRGASLSWRLPARHVLKFLSSGLMFDAEKLDALAFSTLR